MSSNNESKRRAKGSSKHTKNLGQDDERKKLEDLFKGYLDDMKPFVLSLSKKTDRQRIALWIKKLCEPVGERSVDRNNRNLYTQILLHMLRKGKLEEPFDDMPDSGPLPTMPAYMSIYLDEPLKFGQASSKVKNRNAPNWIRSELPSSDSAFSDVLSRSRELNNKDETRDSSAKYRRSPKRKGRVDFQRQTIDTDSSDMDDTRRVSPITRRKIVSPEDDTLTESDEDMTIRHSEERRKHLTPPPSPVRRRLEEDFSNPRYKPSKKWSPSSSAEKPETKKGYSTSFYSNGYSSIIEDKENQRQQDRELQLKVKMFETKFAEEKLSLQQQHDATVQKILDRKNVELEEIKDHYRNKVADQESTIKRLEKKNSRTVRDLSQTKERHDKEVLELKTVIEQNGKNSEVDFERRLHDKVAEFEQEKFDMQKQHTNNIQELLDETNARLLKMEEEHSKQAKEAASVTNNLNTELQQLSGDLESHQRENRKLFQEKEEIQTKFDNLSQHEKDQRIAIAKLEKEIAQTLQEHDDALRILKRKTDSTIDSMKKEQSNATNKVSIVISDLESQVNQYKQALQESELQRKRELREIESNHKQEMLSLEVSQEKKVRQLQNDAEEQQVDFQLRMRKMETTLREKDEKIQQSNEHLKDQNRGAERAIDDFKRQAEENSRKMFREMKEQLEGMESELTKSVHAKEIQERRCKRELEEERTKQNKQIMELKLIAEEERNKILKQHENEKEIMKKEHEKEKGEFIANIHATVKQKEDTSKSKQDKDSKVIEDMEQQIRDLREEVIQANALRKQQLVELGMLRDEEKQNAKRQEDALQVKYRSQLEQQKLQKQKEHSAAMEKYLGKTNSKLKDIETEYALRADKSQDTIYTLQAEVNKLREELSRESSHQLKKISDLTSKREEEVNNLKKQHSNMLKTLNQDIELHRSKSRNMQKSYEELQIGSEESISKLKLYYEDKMKGLLPGDVREELEETINALSQQLSVLQSRAQILQEELDSRGNVLYTLHDDSKLSLLEGEYQR